MKYPIEIFLILVAGILFPSCTNGDTIAVNGIGSSIDIISPEQAKLIHEYTKIFPNKSEFSMAIIEKDTVKFIRVKRTNDTLKQIENRDRIFEIGSISKVFTATLLANLVLDDKLELTDNIQDYIGFKLKSEQDITFEQLANHTSGLPSLPSNMDLSTSDPNNPYKEYDQHKLKEYLTEKIELDGSPGVKYKYSNLGAGLLGFTLTQLTNSTYEDLLQNRIFSKYNMTNTTTKRRNVEKKLVKGLDPEGVETTNWDMGILIAAGGVLSSAKDLSKFAKAQFIKENEELIITEEPRFTIDEKMKVGLGWHLPSRINGKRLIWHNGGIRESDFKINVRYIFDNQAVIVKWDAFISVTPFLSWENGGLENCYIN